MVEDRGQVTQSAAELYDEFFVPALFGAWPRRVVEAARISCGMRVLDVACGSGVLTILAREAGARLTRSPSLSARLVSTQSSVSSV